MNSTEPAPETTGMLYHWVDGAVPPPDHIEFEIDLKGKSGVLRYWPDYPGETTPCWVTAFEISKTDWDQLLDGLNELSAVAWKSNEPPLLGSAMEWLEVQAGDSQWQIPSDLCADYVGLTSTFYQSIRNLVPKDVWLEMTSSRQKYQIQSGM